jgi:adenylate cyclase
LSPTAVDSIKEALRLFTQASALDPDYASAYAMAMLCHAQRAAFGTAKDMAQEKSEVARLWRIVTRVGQEDGVAIAHAAWAVAYVLRDIPAAKQMIDRAVELNPNLAVAWANSGWINVWLGQPDVALEHLRRARRLDPGSPLNTQTAMAHAYFFLDQYEEAVAVAEQMLQHNPDLSFALRVGAASAAFAGRNDVSRRMAGHLQVVDPAFRVSRLGEYLGPYQKPELVEKYAEGLRLAGLPE